MYRVCVCIGVNICVMHTILDTRFWRRKSSVLKCSAFVVTYISSIQHLKQFHERVFREEKPTDVLERPEHEQVSGYSGFIIFLYCDAS